MADDAKRHRQRGTRISVVADVQAAVSTGGGRTSSRQRTRIVQRDGETVRRETTVETTDDDGVADEPGRPTHA